MDRDSFLAEIAARLGRPRRRELPARDFGGYIRPEVPKSELAQRFASELARVGGEVVLSRSPEEARVALSAELGRAEGVVSWARAELERASGLDLSSVWAALSSGVTEPSAPAFRSAALSAEVGITGVDVAVADTGTLVIASGVGRPRSVSLLPRLHVALVRQSQLVTRLADGLMRLRQGRPSALQCVTGPSRTSDIENDLSIGVHGPARVLAIVLLEAEP